MKNVFSKFPLYMKILHPPVRITFLLSRKIFETSLTPNPSTFPLKFEMPDCSYKAQESLAIDCPFFLTLKGLESHLP